MTRLLLMMALMGSVASGPGQVKPKMSGEPLTPEQQAVYRSFLASYSTGADGSVNVADTTNLFAPEDSDKNGCLKGLDLVTHKPDSVHSITSDAIPVHGYVLVNPGKQQKLVRQNDPGTLIRQGIPVDDAVKRGFAAGLLSLSEIAFSRDHHYAVFEFSFYCGWLCGHGAVLIYENLNGTWKEAPHKTCGFWQS